MIKLKDAEIINCISNNLAAKTEIKALSKALNDLFKTMLDYSDKTRLYCDIDNITDNNILDILAIELRTPNYSQNLKLENKRKLIKNTLPFYSAAGNIQSLKTLLQNIFDTDVIIHEWFESNYNNNSQGEPGHFKVKLATQEQIPKNISEQIKNIKRLSAHLDNIAYEFQTLPNDNHVAISIMTSQLYNLKIVK